MLDEVELCGETLNCIPVIDLTATGLNIVRLRIGAGMTVKEPNPHSARARAASPASTLPGTGIPVPLAFRLASQFATISGRRTSY